jgi:hypothetical protein
VVRKRRARIVASLLCLFCEDEEEEEGNVRAPENESESN